VQPDPFGELGLPALADLTDDDVRVAWRRIAAATHPDREDGGDPARFGAAAAAYALLRTSFGRGEALADLGGSGPLRGRRAGRRRAPDMRGPWEPRRPREPQRRGAHERRAPRPASTVPPASAVPPASTVPPARHRHAVDGRYRHAGDTGFPQAVYARVLRAVDAWCRPGRDTGLLRAVYPRFRRAGEGRYRHAGYVSVDRGLALPAGGAALGAAAAVAAAGWTPATIGLAAGALTVTAWGLWRRAGRDR
jgi:curved DNA-binding protein CbpA